MDSKDGYVRYLMQASVVWVARGGDDKRDSSSHRLAMFSSINAMPQIK